MSKIFTRNNLYIAALIIGLLIISYLVISSLGNTPNRTITKPAASPTPTASILPTLTSNRVALGLKLWPQDKSPSVELQFDKPTDISEQELVFKGAAAWKIIAGNNYLMLTIAQGVVPETYTSVNTLKTNNGSTVYRVVLADGTTTYSDELNNTGCHNGTFNVKSPCGKPLLQNILVACSSSDALTFCDSIVQTLSVKWL